MCPGPEDMSAASLSSGSLTVAMVKPAPSCAAISAAYRSALRDAPEKSIGQRTVAVMGRDRSSRTHREGRGRRDVDGIGRLGRGCLAQTAARDSIAERRSLDAEQL